MLEYTINDIENIFEDYNIIGDKNTVRFNNFLPIHQANENSLVWINSNRVDKYELLKNTVAKVIICDKDLDIPNYLMNVKVFISVDKPKLAYLRILKKLNQKRIIWGIHQTAIIHPEAELPKKIYIGPYTVIGKSIIGEKAIIHAHSVINDDVIIGENVTIHSHTLIGSEGFGYTRNEKTELEKFPHIGKVVIEDDVEIFPFVNVDKGALNETRIKKGSKIDHYCHIGHNTLVGENSVITAGSVLCGGSQVGDRIWAGVGSIIKEKVKVGNDVFLGLGTIVTKDIPDGSTWVGSPGRPLKLFLKLQEELKKLSD